MRACVYERNGLIAVVCLTVLLVLGGCAGSGGAVSAKGKDAGFDVAADRPASPKTLYTMARILVSQKREAEAAAMLKQAVAQEPAYLPAFVALAELQLKREGADAALGTLDKAVAASPKDPALHNNRGMCFVAKKDFDAAYEAFTRAVELEPQTARYRANRAMALGMQGKYDQCLAAYATVVSPAEAHHNLSVLCKLRGDMERAEAELRMAESLRKPGPVAPEPADGTPAAPRG